MAPNAPSHRVALGGAPLLLAPVDRWIDDRGRHPDGVAAGPAGSVVGLVDLAGASPAGAAELVTDAARTAGTTDGAAATPPGLGVIGGTIEAVLAALDAGAGLAVVDARATPADEVLAVARRGPLVVLSATDPLASVAVADRLGSAGIDASRVVVEIGPYADPAAAAEAHLGADCLVAAIEHAAYGFRVGAALAPAGSPHHTDGGEIGALTELLLAGVATVRGADPRRFRRVLGIVRALEGAGRGR